MNKNKKIILGLVGEIASGKDTIAEYLRKKYQSQTISFSQPLRDILDRMYLPQNRENMANLGHDLRQRFGRDIIAKAVGQEIEKSKKSIICLPNVRLKEDITYLKNKPGFFLIHIKAEPKIRYQRLTKRSQNTDDQTKTWAQFQRDAKLPTEIQIRRVARQAKFVIDNNGNYKNLYRQTEDIIKKIKKHYV